MVGRSGRNQLCPCGHVPSLAAAVAVMVLSATGANAGQVSLAWDANTEADLAGYKLYIGNSTGIYQSNIDVGKVTTYTVTGLQEGLLYFFAVTAYNTSANGSGYSDEVSTVVADTTPPVISSVAVPVKTASGATITWTTNESSDSQVEYGLTTAYGSSSSLVISLVTAHLVTLGGLTDGTLYHFRVR